MSHLSGLYGEHFAAIESGCWVIRNAEGDNVAEIPVKMFNGNRKPSEFINLILREKTKSYQQGVINGKFAKADEICKALGVYPSAYDHGDDDDYR